MDVIKDLRHTCVLCKKKRTTSKMIKIRASWTCIECPDFTLDPGLPLMKILNLYSGLGGNRNLWKNVSVTAVESNHLVAASYKKLYPEDNVIIGDAHEYLLRNYYKFDFIWSSPPCQTHSRLNYTAKKDAKRYADMNIYQEIIFLNNNYNGKFIVENVKPYYEPLIPPNYQISRHMFWTNFPLRDVHIDPLPGMFDMWSLKDKPVIMKWLGFEVKQNIRLKGGNPIQVFRNCVHPKLGLSIFEDLIKSFENQKANQI